MAKGKRVLVKPNGSCVVLGMTMRGFLLLCLAAAPGWAGSIIYSPRSLASVEGDSSAPDNGLGLYGSTPITEQIQIAAAELSAQGLQIGDTITGVRERLDGGLIAGPAGNVNVA